MRIGFDGIGAASGRDPRETARRKLLKAPLRKLLQLMVIPAQRTEIAAAGWAVLVEGPGVVGVASHGRLAARWEPTGQVS